jgi:hypothetical protein
VRLSPVRADRDGEAAIAAAPGYLNPCLTVDTFVRNRCDGPKAVLAGLNNPICDEVPALQ